MKQFLPQSAHSNYPSIWMGTWVLDRRDVIERAFKLGIRHFDTAHFYAHGRSDRLLRSVCQSYRKDLFISAKGGLVWDGNRVSHDASPASLRQALEHSLLAMDTDYLDLFSYHHPDPKIPWETVKSTLIQFQKERLIRFWGVSNMAVDDPVPHQIHFNPIHRDTIPSHSFNVAYSPLEQGLLSLKTRQLGKKDRRRRNPYFENATVRHWLTQLGHLCDTASDTANTPISVTLRWILAQPGINALILGPKTVTQLNTLWSAIHQSDAIPDKLWDHLTHGPPHRL
jgi:aryl-alcohol dehydrogenase-like predicted oxidoreductase